MPSCLAWCRLCMLLSARAVPDHHTCLLPAILPRPHTPHAGMAWRLPDLLLHCRYARQPQLAIPCAGTRPPAPRGRGRPVRAPPARPAAGRPAAWARAGGVQQPLCARVHRRPGPAAAVPAVPRRMSHERVVCACLPCPNGAGRGEVWTVQAGQGAVPERGRSYTRGPGLPLATAATVTHGRSDGATHMHLHACMHVGLCPRRMQAFVA